MVAKEKQWINNILYDGYYLQNYKAITSEKIANHTKYKKPDLASHLYIFWLNFDKANHSFLQPFLMLGKQIFERMLPRGMSNFLLLRAWWPELGGEFWVGRGMIKMPWINAFFWKVNSTLHSKFNKHSGERD